MQDRYAEGRFLPPIDANQDWFLVSGEEAGGYTTLEFTRNWTTCDDRDSNIQVSNDNPICHNMLIYHNNFECKFLLAWSFSSLMLHAHIL